jgi:hypothetical protein
MLCLRSALRFKMNHENATTVGAVGAILSPAWLPELHNISAMAAELAPILGVLWLVVQIGTKLYVTYRKKEDE